MRAMSGSSVQCAGLGSFFLQDGRHPGGVFVARKAGIRDCNRLVMKSSENEGDHRA